MSICFTLSFLVIYSNKLRVKFQFNYIRISLLGISGIYMMVKPNDETKE